MLKKYITKRAVKRMALGTIEQQVKVLIGAVSTILIHRVIQFLANKYPKLSFLKMAEERTTRPA